MELMDLQSIVENYGYAAILIGTFLEGETILVLAGLAAHQGYLILTWVILAAFAGSLCGDQLFFIWNASTVRRFCPGGLAGSRKPMIYFHCRQNRFPNHGGEACIFQAYDDLAFNFRINSMRR